MKIADFNKTNNPKKHCVAYYVNGARQLVNGVILDGLVREPNKRPYVCVDSYTNKIALASIIKVEETTKDW